MRCPALAASSAAIPLALIAVAALSSGWFNLLDNALSDLGHATRSGVAPLFNLGLSAGGFLMGLAGASCGCRRSRIMGATIAAAGYSLVLIAVFDEVYGRLHFYVSSLFFLLVAVLLAEYAAFSRGALRRASALAALSIGVVAWVLHLAYGIPRGAAVPELISIAAALPFYLDFLGSNGPGSAAAQRKRFTRSSPTRSGEA